MLERIDAEKIFDLADSLGFPQAELYGEVRREIHLRWENRLLAPRSDRVSGVALRLWGPKGSRFYSTSSLCTEALVALMKGEATPPFYAAIPQWEPAPLASLKTRTLNILRTLFPESESIVVPRWHYEQMEKRFEVLPSDGPPIQGKESYAGATASWQLPHQRRPQTVSLWDKNPEAFFRRLENQQPFREAMETARKRANPWPAPQGEIPLLWSPQAFAKVMVPFLSGFEGDRVLGNHSFLNSVALPLPMGLNIEEGGTEGFDGEGAARRPLKIFNNGRPTALACDRSLAQEMEVPPTGHCRRQSFDRPPTVAFWEPRVRGEIECAAPLKEMEWGLWVKDLEVAQFNPSTGEVTLKLLDVFLIHQGEIGEAVRPIVLKTEITHLLSHIQSVSSQRERHWLPLIKDRQRFLISLEVPSARSRPLSLPGDVPPSQYW